MYPIHDLSSISAYRPESLGSKEKVWLRPSGLAGLRPRLHLFKIGRPATGENWAEKLSCAIAELVSLPCAHYDFAVKNGERGVVSEQFMPDGASFVPGNMLLAPVIEGYDRAKTFDQIHYTLSAVIRLVRHGLRNVHPPSGTDLPLRTPVEYFVGYLVLDALIGNTDRHHENWGVVVEGESKDLFRFSLAPTFDHASSLGRSETDEKRRLRLTTTDQRANVEAYAARAKSAFYGDNPAEGTLTLRRMIQELNTLEPEATYFGCTV